MNKSKHYPNFLTIQMSHSAQAVRALIAQAAGVHSSDTMMYPGSMPIGLMRAHVPLVRQAYVCSPKADGVRVLVWHACNHIQLFNRKWELVHSYSSPSVAEPSIYDAEFLPASHRLLLFDIIAQHGRITTSLCYTQRHAMLQPLTVFGAGSVEVKPIGLAKDCAQLLRSATYPTDGVIFTQLLRAYTPGRQDAGQIVKWKNTLDCTCDFELLEDSRGTAFVHPGVPGSMASMLRPEGPPFLGAVCNGKVVCLASLYHDTDFTPGTIVECAYMSGLGWSVERVRDDKSNPNNMKTVLQTMQSIIEDVQLEELQ